MPFKLPLGLAHSRPANTPDILDQSWANRQGGSIPGAKGTVMLFDFSAKMLASSEAL